ncbi:MAG TPA: PTS sugar transporter subunit IIA [Spirochaetota bacterium]
MDLTLKEVSSLLSIPQKEIVRMVKERKIRAYKVYSQYRFNRDELNEWILKGRIPVSNEVLSLVQSSVAVKMYRLFERGGVYYDIEGTTVAEVIRNSVDRIVIPVDTDRDKIVASLLEREELMTTGMGEGLALPHPRNPILADVSSESISICFLKNSVDFNAIDDKPVHTLFIILSANPRRHLEILSKISYLCRNSEFYEMLVSRKSVEEIMHAIEMQDHEWRRK